MPEQAMVDLKADYEGALEARLVAAAAAKDAAFALQQRAEVAEALLAQLRRENEGLTGPLSLVTPPPPGVAATHLGPFVPSLSDDQ